MSARLPAALALLLPMAAGLSCSESSLRIKIVFPDAASRVQSSRLFMHAVDPGGMSCKSILGRTAGQLGAAVLTSLEIDLRSGVPPGELVNVPMRSLLLAALVHDLNGRLFLQACARVDAKPGENLEAVLRLNCAPGRVPCLDIDGDGVPADRDCDDEDPCRSPDLRELASACKSRLGDLPALPAACLAKLQAEGKSSNPPYCDDGIDEDCSGEDERCLPDADCDGFGPPQDCDDGNPAVNPGVTEACDGGDNNCNGVIDEGCGGCDLDGDGHATTGPIAPGCTAPRDDPDDLDAGVHPLTTKTTGGAEGGNLLGALRGWCRSSPGGERDGKIPRDVDHDGDRLPASQDGCPPPSCDADGDGFKGQQCSPPASELDCDDGAPQTFPGAPDRCGDGKAQSCVADTSCTCDGDGDGYCPPADCNDSDVLLHPWATERCNGVDDDCDQLVDEGNPGSQGGAMPTTVKSCNDDNDGFCGSCSTGSPLDCKSGHLLSGICVCSPLQPVGTRDSANRVACPGESLTAKTSPRCFVARQPQKERCNGVDDDCDGTTTDESSEACSGQTCCVAMQSCRDLGSDFSSCGSCGRSCATSPSTADSCKQGSCRCGGGPACTNGHVCEGGACVCHGCRRYGSCENGDIDSACGAGGVECQSCGPFEDCISRKCSCTGCLYQGACVSGTTDTRCGHDGQTCLNCASDNYTCNLKHCVCPSGCVSGGYCYINEPTHCGSGGGVCTACPASPPCQVATCISGSCGTSNTTVPCSGGKCLNGSCCTTCINGASCDPTGSGNAACGIGGVGCVNCTATGLTCLGGACK